MMHLFFALSWFACTGSQAADHCQLQPPPIPALFYSKEDCESAGRDLVIDDPYKHFACGGEWKWLEQGLPIEQISGSKYCPIDRAGSCDVPTPRKKPGIIDGQ